MGSVPIPPPNFRTLLSLDVFPFFIQGIVASTFHFFSFSCRARRARGTAESGGYDRSKPMAETGTRLASTKRTWEG